MKPMITKSHAPCLMNRRAYERSVWQAGSPVTLIVGDGATARGGGSSAARS